MADNRVVEEFVADVSAYVDDVERAARAADRFGEENAEARERSRLMGHAAQEAGERAARAHEEAAREAEKLAEGTGDAQRAARAAARAQRELERAEIAQARAGRAAAQVADHEAEQYRELAREARRAAAAERLAALAAAGEIERHNELLGRLREEFGDLEDDGSGAFREIERTARFSFRAVGSAAMSGIGGIAPMLLALPLIATVAGAGIVLGLGAALAAVPAITAATSNEVRSEFTDLKNDAVTTLREWSEPWEGTLTGLLDHTRETAGEMGPTLRRVFTDTAPVVERFGTNVLDALTELEPMIESVSDAFGRVLDDLGPRLPGILRNIGDGISAISDAVAENPEEFGKLLEDFGALAELAGHLTGLLIRLYPTINTLSGAWDSVSGAAGPVVDVLKVLVDWFFAVSNPISLVTKIASDAATALDGLGVSIGGSKDETLDLSGVMKLAQSSMMAAATSAQGMNAEQRASAQIMNLASLEAKQLKAALDELAGKELTARQAAIQYGQAVDNLSKQIQENGAAHGFNTQKGRENEAALNQLVVAAHKNAVAMRDNKDSAAEVAAYMKRARDKFIDAAKSMDYSEKEARALADKLFGVKDAAKSIPNREHIDVTASTGSARAEINQLIWWASRQAVSVMVNAMGFSQGGLVPGFADGGMVQRFPMGGPVRGPGTSTSDSIAARLSAGEFVVNAAATKEFLPILRAINRQGHGKTMAARPAAPMLAPAPAGGNAPVYVTNNYYNVAGSIWSERELLNVVQKQANKRNVRNPGTNLFGGR